MIQSLNVLYGTGKPQIKVGATTITLPYCASLDEFFTFDCIKHKIKGGNKSSIKKGWYYRAELNYYRLSKEDVESLEPLSDLTKTSFNFYPRSDNQAIKYVVDLPEDFELHLQQMIDKNGHKNITIILNGKVRLTKPFIKYLITEEGEPITTEDGQIIYEE